MLSKLLELPDPDEDNQSAMIELTDRSTPSQIDISVGEELGKMGLIFTFSRPPDTDKMTVQSV